MVIIRPDLLIQNVIKLLSYMLGLVNDFVAWYHVKNRSDVVRIPVPRT